MPNPTAEKYIFELDEMEPVTLREFLSILTDPGKNTGLMFTDHGSSFTISTAPADKSVDIVTVHRTVEQAIAEISGYLRMIGEPLS